MYKEKGKSIFVLIGDKTKNNSKYKNKIMGKEITKVKKNEKGRQK